MSRRLRTLIEILIILGATCARGDVLGIELVGFGPSGPSLTYTAARWVPLRYRIRGAATTGAPVHVILRRDDGATTMVPATTARDRDQTAEVPLRAGGFQLNEYEAFAIEPGGRIHQSRSLSVIHVGAGSSPGALAGRLEETRTRLGRAGEVEAPPSLLGSDALLVADHLAAAGAFDEAPVAGEEPDVLVDALD